MELRQYQKDAVSDIRKSFSNGLNRIVLQSATGSGKTVIFTHIAESVNSKNKKVAIITDRKELLLQAGSKLKDVEYLTASAKKPPLGSVVVCMAETLKRRLKNPLYLTFIKSFDLIIIDEAHKLYDTKEIIGAEKPDIKAIENGIWNSYKKSGKNSCRLMLMSGTPVNESPMEMMKLLNI